MTETGPETPRECILLIEPDILIRQPLAEYLRECGYKVIEATGAGEARQALGAGAPPVDIVLADIDAPGGNGFALAHWIREHHPEIEVILAGSVTKAAEKAGDLCREGRALAKPYEHQFVLERIKSLLAARKRAAGK